MLSILHLVLLSGFINLESGQMMPMSYPGHPPMPYPGPMQFPGQMPFPGSMANVPKFLPHMPGAMQQMPPMSSMPLQMPMALPQHKLPVVVMPFYSKNNKGPPPRRHKKKKKYKKKFFSSESSSESDCDSSSSEVAFRGKRRNKFMKSRRTQEVLSPVVSYVTKDGYVVYQKKIKSDKAKDWLRKEDRLARNDNRFAANNNPMSVDDLKKEIGIKFARNEDYK